MTQAMSERYLGDGLYASDDRYNIHLRAPRDGGDHYVSLAPEVLESFFHFIEKMRGVKITVATCPKDSEK